MSREDNLQHAWEEGLLSKSKGEANHTSVLTEEIVRTIRTLYANGGYTQKRLAEIHNVHTTTIRDAINRKTWKHVI
jgi:hypothetical protein